MDLSFYKVAALLTALLLFCTQIDAYEKPGHVDEKIWTKLSPYFLSEDHPIKPALDKIFSNSRVLKSSKNVSKAGFYSSTPGKYSQVIVSHHPDLPGYLVKMYLDDTPGVQDWAKFKERVQGAISVQESIERHHLQNDIKTPKKWIYPLPENPRGSSAHSKNFILVVEDMNVRSESKNLSLWKSKAITKAKLDGVWRILLEVGLIDCIYAFNIPFCKDGKLAFIDTELHHFWPVKHHKLGYYLKGEMQTYWYRLCEIGGP